MVVLGLVHRFKNDPERVFVLLTVDALVHKVQAIIERIAALDIGKHRLRQMEFRIIRCTDFVNNS